MNPDPKREFRDSWATFAEEHREEISPVEWIEVFSLLSGLVLGLSCTDDEAAERLLDASKGAAFQLFQNIRGGEHITIQ